MLLSRGFGTENTVRPHARPSLRTKSGFADLLRPHAGPLPLTASGCAAGPRPRTAARSPKRSAHARRRPPLGPAWLCDASPLAPPLQAASADPSGCADGRCPRALVRRGRAAREPPPAPAAAGLPPPPLLGQPGTVGSAPAWEETARGEVRKATLTRLALDCRSLPLLVLGSFRAFHLSRTLYFVGNPPPGLTLPSWASLSAPAWRSEWAARALFTAAAQCRAVFPRERRGRLSPEAGDQTPGFSFPLDPGLGGRAIRARRVLVAQRQKRCPGDRRRAESIAPGDVTGARKGQWGIVLGSVGPEDPSTFSPTLD